MRARTYEMFPLLSRLCGAGMRIIAFITGEAVGGYVARLHKQL